MSVVITMARQLTPEETQRYLIAWRCNHDEDALTLLMECNKGLVCYFASIYLSHSYGLTFDELVSAGNEGLYNAINRFDYTNTLYFSSYISEAIKNSMLNDIKKWKKHSHVLSFDQPIGHSKDGDDLTIEDIIGTDEDELVDNVISNMKNEVVRDALKSLTSREQKIILLRFGLDDKNRKTQEEVAAMFDCSVATIASQEKKALIKMRHPKNTRKLKDFLED